MRRTWPIWTMLVAGMLLCTALAFRHFHFNHVWLPSGCDSFGYLHQAEAVRDGVLFDEHTPRPFFKELSGSLAEAFPNTPDYSYIIAPHAYHFDENPGKVINQYPPGTALLLSVFPKEWRQVAYPALVSLLMGLLLVLLTHVEGWRLAAAGSLVILFTSAMMALPGTQTFFVYIGSEGPVIPLLVAAGVLLRSRPMWSIALVSVSAVARIADVWMLPVIALPVFFREWLEGGELPSFRVLAGRVVKTGIVVLLTGFGWILLYQWLYVGSPFRGTYPVYDQRFATGARALENLSFYFVEQPEWAIFTAAALGGTVLLYWGRGRRWVLAWAFLLAAWNYLFFIAHDVHASYYPFAAAFVIFGLWISGLDALGKRFLCVATCLFALSSAWAMRSIWFRHDDMKQPDLSVSVQSAAYRDSFAKADVVWAAEQSGTVEYAAGIPAFRPYWGTQNAEIHIMRWLAAHGYRQAFHLDDENMRPDEVLDTVKKSGLGLQIENDQHFGRIGWIEPDRAAEQSPTPRP